MFYLFNVCALLLIIVILVAFALIKYAVKEKHNNKLPVPVAYPFIESMLVPSHQQTFRNLWHKRRRSSDNCHPIPILTPKIVSIQHPDDIEILINIESSMDRKNSYSDYVCPWLKNTISTASGEKSGLKNRTMSVLKLNVIRRFLIVIKKKSVAYLKNMKICTTPDKIETRLLPLYFEQAMNIIYANIILLVAEAAVNVDLDKLEKSYNDVDKSVHDLGNIVNQRWYKSDVKSWMLQPVKGIDLIHKNTVQMFHNLRDKVKIQEKYHRDKAVPKKEFIDKVNSYDVLIRQRKRLAMLELLLQDNKNSSINITESIDGEDAFIFEGHNKSGMAINFLLLLLAENKEVQNMARIEVFRVLNNNKGKINLSCIKEFQYLERCIKESLRLFPPVATLVRYIPEDLQLKNLSVPGGSHTLIHLFELHRDPNFWTKPEKFDPDRFLPENSKRRHPYAYLPFSAGPRNCKGQKFAIMELKAIMVQILYEYYLEPIDRTCDIKLAADPILRTTHPVRTKFVKIKNDKNICCK